MDCLFSAAYFLQLPGMRLLVEQYHVAVNANVGVRCVEFNLFTSFRGVVSEAHARAARQDGIAFSFFPAREQF